MRRMINHQKPLGENDSANDGAEEIGNLLPEIIAVS